MWQRAPRQEVSLQRKMLLLRCVCASLLHRHTWAGGLGGAPVFDEDHAGVREWVLGGHRAAAGASAGCTREGGAEGGKVPSAGSGSLRRLGWRIKERECRVVDKCPDRARAGGRATSALAGGASSCGITDPSCRAGGLAPEDAVLGKERLPALARHIEGEGLIALLALQREE